MPEFLLYIILFDLIVLIIDAIIILCYIFKNKML